VIGFALAFARALGEYGSVVFVSGNMPYRTEIAPVLIVARLEEFAYGDCLGTGCRNGNPRHWNASLASHGFGSQARPVPPGVCDQAEGANTQQD
jgi:hypothetical protein